MTNIEKYADIILPVPLPKLFTYKIPDDIVKKAGRGRRVIVQFGKKKIYTGIIKKIHDKKPEYKTKNIISVIDEKPVINEFQLKFWDWISEYYMCSLGEIYKAALPAGLKLESETNIRLNHDADTENISEKEEIVIGLLSNTEGMSIKNLEKETDFNVIPVLKKLSDKNIITAEEKIINKYKPKYEEYIKIPEKLYDEKYLNEVLNNLKRAKKQSKLLLSILYLSKYGSDKYGGIKPAKEFIKKDIIKFCQTTPALIKALTDKKILISEKKETDRLIPAKHNFFEQKTLNDYQLKALNEIKEKFKEKNTVLLHGVTSSGKTEIYIKLAEEQLKKGKQVLYLLPEIALTTQITVRLEKKFGKKLGVYHSKFNDNERVEVWNKLQKGEYKIILGVRSSVFLPFDNLGLIIVDEEHENTYKQYNPAPRYNAANASTVLASFFKAKVLLGTATPSVESYYNAKTGKFGLVTLTKRYSDIKMPEIITADVKDARRKKRMKSLFTPEMIEAIETALKNKEQIILFQNRRGFSPYVECEICGYVPKCRNCDVSLTYHKNNNYLVCHYCGYSEQATKICKACESPAMKTSGFGTQKIEDEIHKFFPEAKTARMDLDSTLSKKSYHKIIYDFENGNTDILIGTQMISKGLDFDNVALVGIMNADNMLNFPDFRAYEKSYQLMAQVSGRAGRKNKQGKVIIQTTDKNNKIIKYVIKNDYETMFLSQLKLRKQFKYPPFYRLMEITVKHKNKYINDKASEMLAYELKKVLKNRVLGPEAPVISVIKNYNIKVILLKIEKKLNHKIVKRHINNAINNVLSREEYKYVKISPDVDPL